MVNKMSSVLGIGLLLLWGFGLGYVDANSWLTWFVGIAAVFAFAISVLVPAFPNRSERVKPPSSLAVYLLVMGSVGLLIEGARWLPGLTLGFAIAFGILAVSGTRKTEYDRISSELRQAG